jgi:predicted dehydrogenase
MILTPDQRNIGRRNFLRALAGTPALGLLGAASAMQGPVRGGPVRLGVIGVGGQGRALLGRTNPAFGEVRALSDINPTSLARADDLLKERKRPAATHYVEFREMLEKEDIEAVIVAVPLWAHADVVVPCLEAGKHVLCEKMMAWDVAGCERMIAAAQKNRRILEIGYQRNYSPLYRAAYDGIVARGLLGDVYHVRLAWHRNGDWRRTGQPPSPDYDPSRWGYPTFEHLLNWRLYTKYSRGLYAELASHQVNAANWFLGSRPEAVMSSAGVYRFDDGTREEADHTYSIFEYPGGITATFSSIESNALDQRYEVFYGTRATLYMYNESEALLFEEGGTGQSTAVEVSATPGGAAVDASETRPASSASAAAGRPATAAAAGGSAQPHAGEFEISGFCSAVRTGQPLKCGPEKAFDSARACIGAHDAVKAQAKLNLKDAARRT